jgi:hypothetical protein
MSTREGGCFCGAVRYRVEGEPVDAGYCHCRMCQRSVGAPAVAWGTWRRERFAWLMGEPRALRSSPPAERLFCGACGTQLVFVAATDPERLDINLATLDDPASVRPDHHSWMSSRVPWFEVRDDLPRYQEGAVEEREGRRQEES